MPEVPPPEDLKTYDVTGARRPRVLRQRRGQAGHRGLRRLRRTRGRAAGCARPSARAVDVPAAAFLLDALWPAAYPRLDTPVGAPTVDLTMHFRRELPATEAGEFVLGRFSSRLLHDGFFEEDGELWAPDGRLLAQSRQLAIVLPGTNRVPNA